MEIFPHCLFLNIEDRKSFAETNCAQSVGRIFNRRFALLTSTKENFGWNEKDGDRGLGFSLEETFDRVMRGNINVAGKIVLLDCFTTVVRGVKNSRGQSPYEVGFKAAKRLIAPRAAE